MLRCPWHCWEFDIRTGQSWCDPDSVHARTYAVEVEPGATLAKGPFEAETVPVTVEQDYVVITV
jgi:3-phenylpropionate/trans-cinnamate dioxygenase ferredoxin subunit